jgi:hypothetical protein
MGEFIAKIIGAIIGLGIFIAVIWVIVHFLAKLW